MQIKLINFGPIKEFKIDLEKDFHLLVGENNIGKSYAITAIYLIIKSLLDFSPRSSSIFGFNNFMLEEVFENKDLFKNVKEISEKLKNSEQKEDLDISHIIAKDVEKIFETLFLPKLRNSLINTFSSLDNLFNRYSEEPLEIHILTPLMNLVISSDQASLKIKEIKFTRGFIAKKSARNIDVKFKENKTILYFCEGKESEFPHYYINSLFSWVFLLFNEFSKTINSVHYLPASRSGLYQALSAFGQIVAELSKNRSFLSKKIELPGISEPVSDYFIRLSDIKVNKKSYEDKKINQIAKKIEDEILKGKIEFNPQTKQLMFYPNETNLKLELSSTSSMVSELAPIVSYLRYVLTQPTRTIKQRDGNKTSKNLIMIEEPEAHLHPLIQIKLTKIFSELVETDVKLILTSHSNYIFHKVNNLIMNKELKTDTVNSEVFKQSPHGSITQVLEVNDLGIEDNNFSVATASLFDEKINIINNINATE